MVINRLIENIMKVNVKKIQNQAKLLGVTINGEDQEISIKRNEVLEYPELITVKGLRRFLGMSGWFSHK